MADYEKPIGTRSIGILSAGATTTCAYAGKGNRLRVFGTSAGEVRITIDGSVPSGAAGPVADNFSVQLGAGTTVIDLWSLVGEVKVNAYGADTAGLVVSLSRVYEQSVDRA